LAHGCVLPRATVAVVLAHGCVLPRATEVVALLFVFLHRLVRYSRKEPRTRLGRRAVRRSRSAGTASNDTPG
jgi:hypothetical protein